MFGHRQQAPLPGGPVAEAPCRIADLMEALRSEFEALQQECNFLKHHREDFDVRTHDIAMVHRIIGDLERSHLRMKQQYEDEIRGLKHELELCQRSVSHGVPTALAFHPLPSLELEMQSIGASFLNASLPNGLEGAAVSGGYFGRRTSDNEHVRVLSSDEPLHGRNHTTGTLATSQSGEEQSAYTQGQKDRAGGYDWLVVYNPKASRSVSVSLVHTLAHDGVVCSVRFNPAGDVLATGGNKAVRLFDARSGQVLSTLVDPEMDSAQDDQFFRSIAFSPDGRTLASGAEDSAIRVWNVESQELLFRLEGHEQDVYSVEFFDGGSRLASGSGDKTVKLWDLQARRQLATLHAGTPDSSKDSGITSLSVSPNGKFLAAGSLDRLIRIWALPSGQPVDVIEGHLDSIYSIAFTSDGRHLLSGSLDRTVRLWEFESEDYLKGAVCKHDMVGHRDFVLSVTGSPDARYFLTGSKDRSVQCWDRESGTAQFMLQGHKNSVIGIAFAPAGNVFATASGDFRARIWSFEPFDGRSSSSSNGSGSVAAGIEHEAKQRRVDCSVDEGAEETGESGTDDSSDGEE